jgi:hypothetical protein
MIQMVLVRTLERYREGEDKRLYCSELNNHFVCSQSHRPSIPEGRLIWAGPGIIYRC